MFFNPGYDSTPFELRVKTDDWLGSFTDLNGQKNELKLSLMTSKILYGVGLEPLGAFVVDGHVDTRNYSVFFAKTYFDKLPAPKIIYNG